MQPHPAEIAHNSFDASLYDRFAATIFTYLLSQVLNEQDAEDLLLDVFLAALNNTSLSSLPAQGQLAWLRRVAHNKVIDRYRHVALLTLLPIEQAMETIDDALTPEQHAEQQEKFTHLYQAIAHLPALQRELLRLRYREELHFYEIAALLEKPEGTVRKLMVRTLRELRTIYDQLEEGGYDEPIR
ncbi:MAG TPA: sigma-70 family RNA polymerase sigma factor [Ktedonobacteraceae bacterium]